MRSQVKRGFTLIEILIVVVILGILAAIVIPQFTNASEQAADSSTRSQLQTIRSQIELYRVQNFELPDLTGADPWVDLTSMHPEFGRYLQQAPRNAMRNNATGVVVGAAVPPAASSGAAGDGWYWNPTEQQLYAIDRAGNLGEF
jgi:general secretion pathway protein G